MWIVGLLMSIGAAAVGALGKLGLKKRHMLIAADEGKSSKRSHIVLVMSLFALILNPVLDVTSYAYLSQTMKAPLAGAVILFNVVFAPFIVDEMPSRIDLLASALICVGTITFAVVGPKAVPDYTFDELLSFFSRTAFLIFCAVISALLVGLALCIWLPSISEPMKKAAYGIASGVVGGLFFFTKCFATFFKIGSAEPWEHWQAYGIALGALGSALGGLLILNAGLERYSAYFIPPIFQGVMMITSAAGGATFFNELKDMTTVEMAVYIVGLAIILAGIAILCLKDDPDRPRALHLPPQDAPPSRLQSWSQPHQYVPLKQTAPAEI